MFSFGFDEPRWNVYDDGTATTMTLVRCLLEPPLPSSKKPYHHHHHHHGGGGTAVASGGTAGAAAAVVSFLDPSSLLTASELAPESPDVSCASSAPQNPRARWARSSSLSQPQPPQGAFSSSSQQQPSRHPVDVLERTQDSSSLGGTSHRQRADPEEDSLLMLSPSPLEASRLAQSMTINNNTHHYNHHHQQRYPHPTSHDEEDHNHVAAAASFLSTSFSPAVVPSTDMASSLITFGSQQSHHRLHTHHEGGNNKNKLHGHHHRHHNHHQQHDLRETKEFTSILTDSKAKQLPLQPQQQIPQRYLHLSDGDDEDDRVAASSSDSTLEGRSRQTLHRRAVAAAGTQQPAGTQRQIDVRQENTTALSTDEPHGGLPMVSNIFLQQTDPNTLLLGGNSPPPQHEDDEPEEGGGPTRRRQDTSDLRAVRNAIQLMGSKGSQPLEVGAPSASSRRSSLQQRQQQQQAILPLSLAAITAVQDDYSDDVVGRSNSSSFAAPTQNGPHPAKKMHAATATDSLTRGPLSKPPPLSQQQPTSQAFGSIEGGGGGGAGDVKLMASTVQALETKLRHLLGVIPGLDVLNHVAGAGRAAPLAPQAEEMALHLYSLKHQVLTMSAHLTELNVAVNTMHQLQQQANAPNSKAARRSANSLRNSVHVHVVRDYDDPVIPYSKSAPLPPPPPPAGLMESSSMDASRLPRASRSLGSRPLSASLADSMQYSSDWTKGSSGQRSSSMQDDIVTMSWDGTM